MPSVKSPSSKKWQFWIDRGGTFTDVIAVRPDTTLATVKMLSENPEQYSDAAVAAIRQLMGLQAEQAIPVEQIEVVKMGTTVATNALLERKGEPTVLLTTRGFKDSLRIAYQNRPRLFDRQIILPEQLYAQVYEIDERIAADGSIPISLSLSSAKNALQDAWNKGYRCVAIVFMHAYRYTQHEVALGQLAREMGFSQVSVSHEVSPLIKYVARGDTTVVDAYLSPILRRYVDQIASQLPGVNLQFMQSHGGLTAAQTFRGKDSILSGPAAGMVGMAKASELAGFKRVIGFDMGGTSTDVSHYAGEFERAFETQVAGVRLRAPMMSIHTVAAGGGSILHFDGARMQVGPDSAGAYPGPASYRRGGSLTVTDCNLMLGKIQADYFPAVFGPEGKQLLDREIVVQKFTELAGRISKISGIQQSPEQVAEGFLEIAVANMANAIKKISVQRGYDVSRYVLATFGGAGGQHACRVADALGISQIFSHSLAGVLSAYGMGVAAQVAMREKTIEAPLFASASELQINPEKELSILDKQACEILINQGICPSQIKLQHYATLKYAGTDTAIAVKWAEPARMQEAFEAQYKQRFAFLMQNHALVIESIYVQAISEPPVQASSSSQVTQAQDCLRASTTVSLFTAGKWHRAALYQREVLQAGDCITGPAIIAEKNGTFVVEPEWQAELTAQYHLLISRTQPQACKPAIGTEVDPVRLEMFNNLFMNIAEQMGYVLQNTAYSVNIKERLDFSCAIFDALGSLIANAPHIPVHLGSMGESIKSVMTQNAGTIHPGDVYVLNDPYAGGTHLPDVTVITPVFDATSKNVLFYVASRGHHADLGGLTPGSMPADSKTIDEEGVLISNFKLVDGSCSPAQFREQALMNLLTHAPYPARNPQQNRADLLAQIAANQRGVEELGQMVKQFGIQVVQAYMGHVQDNAEESVRRVISTLKDGAFELELDNGAVIKVNIKIDQTRREATIDFSGTSPQLDNNFNAPSSVTTAAVLYVFRTLVDKDIPLNAGCLKPLHIIIPAGSMLKPLPPAAVVSGNVETSSCITNALYGALGIMASAQSTMNNFTFGNLSYQYYETLAGGSGAGEGFHGTSVVQTHMTNSRLTDPEVLELRFPVQLQSHEIHKNSGGLGQWRGGDGAVRRIKFLQTMTASILSNNRVYPPFGMAGGQAGALGRNWVQRKDGSIETMGHAGSTQMQPGDIFVIETPGGGGYGK